MKVLLFGKYFKRNMFCFCYEPVGSLKPVKLCLLSEVKLSLCNTTLIIVSLQSIYSPLCHTILFPL